MTVEWPLKPESAPEGSLDLEVTYKPGNHSSADHLPTIGRILEEELGCVPGTVFPGSLNFHADGDVSFPRPASVQLGEFIWHFVPVVIQNAAVGIAARRAGSGDIPFIEVFACQQLQPILGLQLESRVGIRLLPGTLLSLAA